MHFLHPWYFFCLLLIPIYLIRLFLKKPNKDKAVFISVFTDLKQAQTFSIFNYLSIIKSIIIILLIILFTISLTRPQGAYEKTDMNKKGIDIILALDVSESMLAEDLKPNRIEAAKESISQFIEKIENDRLGIIVFAGQAFTQSPLSFDYNILKEYLQQISTESINKRVRGLSGTAIGDAILAAVNRFKKSEDRSKVLILLTDGDANTGIDPLIAARKANQEKIKVYTIGIGKKGGAPLPVKDFMGRKQYAKNRDGSLFMATFNEENLKKVAQEGRGRYFRAGDNSSFNKVLNEINQLEKREIQINVNTEYQENFQFTLNCLFFTFILFLLTLFFKPIQN